MRTSVDRLFAGESLEREDLERMAAHFSAKWGRRCFSLALNQARAKEEIGTTRSRNPQCIIEAHCRVWADDNVALAQPYLMVLSVTSVPCLKRP
jgi:hypothetical protein